MLVHFKFLSESATFPTRAHTSDACWDLYASVPAKVKDYTTVHTSIAVNIPAGYCGMVMSRSGLASKHGVFVLNAPGIIDAGYHGEVKVVLANLGKSVYNVNKGDRIAQLMIVPLTLTHLLRGDSMVWGLSERGANGFGSTGD